MLRVNTPRRSNERQQQSQQRQKGSQESKEIRTYRRDHDLYRKSIMISPEELAATRAIAARHHKHSFVIEDGVATVHVRCKGCPLRQGAFKEWVLSSANALSSSA